MADQSVGRVAVEVVPDATDFAKKAQAELDKQNVDPKSVDVKPTIAANMAELRTQMEALAKRLNTNAQVKVTTDVSMLDEIDAMVQRVRNVDIKPVVSKTAKAVAEASLAILTHDRVVNLVVKTGKGGLGVASVLSGFSALVENVQKAHHAIMDMFKDLPQFATMTTAAFGLAGAFLAAAGNAASLAGSVVQALPVLLALPGVAIGLTVLTIAFGNLQKTMPGVYKELQNFKSSIQQDFWSAPVKGVGTVKDAFAGFLNDIVGSFGRLAGTMGTFMGTLFAQFQKLPLGTWFGNLSASVVALQGYMGPIINMLGQFGSIGSAMLVPLANLVGQLADQFGNWLAQLAANAGGVQAFADQSVAALQGIINFVIQIGRVLGTVFSAALQSGSLTFTSLGNIIQGWANNGGLASLKATLTDLFASANTMVSNFATTAGGSLGAAFGNLTKLLEAVLPVVGTITGTITKLFASAITPEAMAGVQAFISGIAAGVQAMQPAFASLGPLIGQLGPVLGLLAGQIGSIFGALTPTIENLVPAITPIIYILGKGLIQVIQKLSPMITQLGQILTQALTSPAFEQALNGIVGLIMALIPALNPIIAMVASLIGPLLQIVNAILAPITTLIQQLVPVLTPIATAITGIVAAIMPLITPLINLMMAVITPLIPVLVNVAGSFLPALVTALQALTTALLPVIDALTVVVSWLMDLLAPALQFIAGVIGDAVIGAINGVTSIFQGAVELVQGIWDTFAGLFTGNWSEFWNGIANIFKGVWDLIVGIIEVAINVGILKPVSLGWDLIKGIFEDSGAFLKGLVTDTWDFIVGLFETAENGLVDGVVAAWDAVKGFFSGGIGDVVTFMKELPGKIVTAVGDLARLLYVKGTDLLNGLLDGINKIWLNIVEWFYGLGSKVVTAIGDLSKLLYDIGNNILQGLLNGLKAAWQTVVSWVEGAANWIKDKFSSILGIFSPSRVFRGFGEYIVEGLVLGLGNRQKHLEKAVGTMADTVTGADLTMPSISGGVLSSAAAIVAAASSGSSRVLNYYAASGSGLNSQDELFAAAGRGRMVW